MPSSKRIIKMTQLYVYLNKMGLCDQVHKWRENEYIFYHWNTAMSNLIPALIVKDDEIFDVRYSRDVIPAIYKNINAVIVNDLTQEHKFVRDKTSGENK